MSATPVCRDVRCALPPEGPVAGKLWWRLAAELVSADCDRPGDANQAMMELGATLCTKSNPRCEACPLASVCAARREISDDVLALCAKYPAAKPRVAPRAVRLSLCVLQRLRASASLSSSPLSASSERAQLWRAGEFALVERSDGDALLAKALWELPGAAVAVHASGEACSAALRNALLRDVGLDLATTRPLCHVAATDAPLAHSITNKRYAISVSWMVLQTDARLEERHQDAPRLCWLTESELNSKGTSSAILKAIQAAKTLALKDQDDDKMTN